MGLLGKIGLTLSATTYAGVLKGTALFPVLIVLANVAAVLFAKSSASDKAIDLLLVPTEKVPALVIVALVFVALSSGIFVILGIEAFGSYNNNHPRKMKGEALAESHPALFRLQCAHNNALENLAMATPCFWAATTHGLEPLLFAKLAVFLFASRVLYIVAYVLDEDILRTFFFVSAITAAFDIGLGAIFPGAISKYA